MTADTQVISPSIHELTFRVGNVPCPPALRAEVAVAEQLARQHKLPIKHMFTDRLFIGERRFPVQDAGYEWRFMPMDEDPLWEHPHGFPLPDRVLARLDHVERAGINWSTFYICHQVPLQQQASGSRSTLAELEPPPSRAATETSTQMGALSTKLFQAASLPFRAATGGIVAGVAIGAAAASSIAAPVAALALLDPILFGCLLEPGQPVCAGAVASYWYIDAWVYE